MIVAESHCSGIGAPELSRPHWRWQLGSEIEAFPRSILTARHHHGRLWGDFSALRYRHYSRLGLIIPDVIVAGTPCQAFSVAGLRKGLDDDRGNLTLAYVRHVTSIANAAKFAGKPAPVAVWENVPGVLSDKTNAFGCLLGGLVGADNPLSPPKGESWPRAGMVSGPRSRVAWRVLDAQYFGVPQRRRRIFLVADFGNRADPAKILFEPRSVRGDIAPGEETGAGIAGAIGSRVKTRAMSQAVAMNLRGRLGGAMPEIDDKASLRAADGGSSRSYVAHTLRSEGFDASEDGSGRGTPLVPIDGYAVRRLTPVECERLQGLPDNFTRIAWGKKALEDCPDGPRYKAIGNSMAEPVIDWVLSRLEAELI